MATATGIERQRQKAMMYVFARRVPKIVSVTEMTERNQYRVRCEETDWPGRYYYEYFPMGDGFDKQISDALKHLTWIAEGNEFPEKA